MGNLGDFTAKNSNITRQEVDEYALGSHLKAVKAIQEGKFKEEITKVEIPSKKETIVFEVDEGPRVDTTLEALSKLKPAFSPDGVLTAGNSPSLNDGASALVVVSEDKVREKGLKPIARILAYTYAHVEPKMLFYAPVYAVKKLLSKLGWTIHDFDLIEANEAFSAQALADGKELGWDWNKVNVNGGAIALGHPIGASGARILTTLLYALKDRGGKRGLATLCLGGGGAVALAIEMI